MKEYRKNIERISERICERIEKYSSIASLPQDLSKFLQQFFHCFYCDFIKISGKNCPEFTIFASFPQDIFTMA